MGDRRAAISFFNQAVPALNDKTNPDHQKAGYQLFSSACLADPTWSTAFYQCGNNSSDLEHLHSAIACWRRALQCEQPSEEKARSLANLGWRLHCLGRSQEALVTLQQSIDINPSDAPPWVTMSCVHQVLDNPAEYLRTGEMAYALAPTDAMVETNYAFANLYARNLAKGLKHFEARFAYKLKSYLQFPYPKWEGQEGGTVYLDADQGIGDTLSFARFVPLAAKRAKYIHVCTQPELLRLFYNAFVGLPNVNVVPKPCGFLPADYWSTFVSLPFALGLTDDEIKNTPHLPPPRAHIPVNWRLPDRKLHVGIAWAGSDANDINKHRSIPIQQFYELYRVPGVQLYSLQFDSKRQQLYDTGGLPLIIDLARHASDVVDTVTLLKDLDLVITCESALWHIAALAQKECWVAYSYLGRDYRVGLTGQDQFWGDNLRIFRQGPDMQWGPVFDKIVEALEERVR